jgi:ABC-2 type transport system permease protein
MNLQLFKQTWRSHWKSFLSWAAVLVVMNSIELSVYPTMAKSGDSMKTFLDSFPDFFKKMFRMEDYFTGPGFLNTELFSLIIPMVMIGVGLAWGSSATAEDEERGSADLLFALPITRSKILWSRLIAMISALSLLAIINFINLIIGAKFVDMQLDAANLAAGSLGCLLIGVLFASFGALFGAISGRKGASLGIGSGFAILFYVFYTLTAIVDKFDFVKPINPFQWLIEANQLIAGFNWATNMKFLILSAVAVVAASWIINRRDIHAS